MPYHSKSVTSITPNRKMSLPQIGSHHQFQHQFIWLQALTGRRVPDTPHQGVQVLHHQQEEGFSLAQQQASQLKCCSSANEKPSSSELLLSSNELPLLLGVASLSRPPFYKALHLQEGSVSADSVGCCQFTNRLITTVRSSVHSVKFSLLTMGTVQSAWTSDLMCRLPSSALPLNYRRPLIRLSRAQGLCL